MAEDLDDGEFWLPSHFLTDDDILMDFDFSAPKVPNSGLGFVGYGSSSSNSNSDLELTSGCTETESDEEDILLSGLTRKMAHVDLQNSSCPVHSKGYVLSSSPQSTLCGCLCNHGSSRESLSPPQAPPQNDDKSDDNNSKENSNNATLDLLNKAAGEVARLKMKTEKSTGTGFFDCSQKGVLYPSPLRNPDHFPPIYYQPQFHHFPPMVWAPSNGVQYNQAKQQQPQPLPQNRATNNNKSNNKSNGNNNNNNNNRPLGLPPSAWPTLQQVQAQNQAHPMPPQPMFVGPKRECNGTGVFLPRSVTTTPSVPRKKSDGNATKSSKAGKGSQSQSSHRRNARATTTPTASSNEIKLPQEWTY